MNYFDSSIIHLLNGFVRHSWTFDAFVTWLTGDQFQKSGIVALLLWWSWFAPAENLDENREKLAAASLLAPASLLVSRLISYLVPYRLRPLHTDELDVHLAYTMAPDNLIDWNSFPSDHAALFFTIAAGIYAVSRRTGLLALAYVLLVICMPRVYLGIHYPTDIMAGALLGFTIGSMVLVPRIRTLLCGRLLSWIEHRPHLFYACAFFYTFQIADSFGWVRDTAVFAATLFVTIMERHFS